MTRRLDFSVPGALWRPSSANLSCWTEARKTPRVEHIMWIGEYGFCYSASRSVRLYGLVLNVWFVFIHIDRNIYNLMWSSRCIISKLLCIISRSFKQNYVLKSIIFWDMTPCSPKSFNRRFGKTYRLHFHGRRNKFSKNQQASSLPPVWLLVFAELISSTLKMEAICSSKTSVQTRRTTRRHIPEDGTLHNHRCENLKSCKITSYFSFRLWFL
jgi:hypothetical protein